MTDTLLLYVLFQGDDMYHIIKQDHSEYDNYVKEYGKPVTTGDYPSIIKHILMQD